MSIYWNKRVKDANPYVPGEQPRDRRFIKLNTNENPYPPSPKVAEAVLKVLADGNAAGDRLRLYPDPACTALREAAALRMGVKPGQVFAGNGSDEVLAFAFAAFFESGSSLQSLPLLFPDISYSFYPVYAGLWDVPFKTIPLTEDFSINLDDYRVPCCGAILPNPNAPTGKLLDTGSILALAERLRAEAKVFIVDEAYIAFGGESLVPLIDRHPNLLVIHTLSKSASLAGLRVGFAFGSEDLIAGLCRIRDSFNSYTLDCLAQAGAAAALSDAAYYDAANRKVAATRDRVSAALTGLGFELIPSRANFIFAKAPGISGADFFARLRECGILVRRFNRDRIEDYLRISIGTDEEMDTFIEECSTILKQGQKH